MLDRAKLEAQLTQLPLYQYAFLKPEELPFSSRLQTVCQENCPMYGKSWSCPPAVGTVDACRARCLAYPEALLVVTVQEVADSADLAAGLATKPFHNRQVQAVRQLLQDAGQRTLCLSGDACARCDVCAYPAPCRLPAQQTPCLEGYGVVVSALAERSGIPFPPEPGLIFWYAVLLFGPEDA